MRFSLQGVLFNICKYVICFVNLRRVRVVCHAVAVTSAKGAVGLPKFFVQRKRPSSLHFFVLSDKVRFADGNTDDHVQSDL